MFDWLIVFIADKVGPTMTVLRQDIHQNIKVTKIIMNQSHIYVNAGNNLRKLYNWM
jgi:hypothetical protein